jgi:two-component system NtrC family response regulator
MNESYHILIVEDEPLAGKVILDTLTRLGYDAVHFTRAEEALVHFNSHATDLVILDIRLPGMSGEELFSRIHAQNPGVPVIFMTAYSSVEKAVQLLRAGAFTYLTKPIEMDGLLHAVRQAWERATLESENRRLTESLREKFSFGHFVFASDRMQQVMSLVTRAADSSSTILISGESGTGKEVIANILHHASARSARPLVKVNLAALPATLIEAELFGAMKGAYTGAGETRIGKFEEADGGTLFLDEIGELPPETQVKLLRVIQERELVRLGSNKPITIDIRLITATNRDLAALVREKKFREDLFFRLNVINIELPPLRQRRDEIRQLTDLFIRKYAQREKKSILRISREAQDLLIKYDYPGNIRELENIIERAVVLTRETTLTSRDLPVHLIQTSERDALEPWETSPLPLAERLEQMEKRIIAATLEKNRFHQSKTALELGISESGLRYKMQSLGLERK